MIPSRILSNGQEAAIPHATATTGTLTVERRMVMSRFDDGSHKVRPMWPTHPTKGVVMSRIQIGLLALMLPLLLGVPARAELPPLVPRQVLFSNPVQTLPEISPDGTRLAYLAPDKNGTMQVWVQTLGKEDARQVTSDQHGIFALVANGFRSYYWSYKPDTLLYLQDNEGDENWHVFAVDLARGTTRDLTNLPANHPLRAEVVGLDPNFPNELLVGLNLDDVRVLDVYRIDLTTGKAILDTKNPGNVLTWGIDPNFQVRASLGTTPDGGRELRYRPEVQSAWQTVLRWGPDDADGKLVGFTADGKGLWLSSSENRDTLGVVRLDLATGKEALIAAQEGTDADYILFNPVTHTVEAVVFNRERNQWKAIDPTIAGDLAVLEQAGKGEFAVASRDRAARKWVVAYESDVEPSNYSLYDRETKTLTPLFASRPALAKYQLAPMKPVVIQSRDGLELVSYLTLPVGVEGKQLPMVVLVHGGPWLRDRWGFNEEAQWLANRGYAVLQVNFRASSGFGKQFLHAGDREWGGKMHNDLIDAVAWAVREGIADPKRVAIYGASYGGYAALVGATFTPDVFACAVDIVGPSNLVTFMNSFPPYWETEKEWFSLRIGDPQDEAFLKSRSPLFKVDQIKIPLLVVQGANDPRVPKAEAEQIVAAMRQAGKPVTYLLFADEGHAITRAENRMRLYTEAEAFLAAYLGGRSETATSTP
jgi:dipeptidyl aminopeptidase/acylaminoacyl peptidase